MQVLNKLGWDLARTRCLVALVTAAKSLPDAIVAQRYVGWVRVG